MQIFLFKDSRNLDTKAKFWLPLTKSSECCPIKWLLTLVRLNPFPPNSHIPELGKRRSDCLLDHLLLHSNGYFCPFNPFYRILV